ncbi:hypothetical protein HK101_007277 [Irineochytrium annulatum]|nr:hypothetical protein HK101_007277 [Irineochytrium annulatum]
MLTSINPPWAAAAAAGAVVVYAILRQRHYVVHVLPTETALVDLPDLGKDSPHGRKGRHAVVVGGSWAGLMAARVLLDHFDAVTVLESEKIGDGEGNGDRSHVPQYWCNHLLLSLGLRVAETLMPGFQDECIRRGAHRTDFASDVRFNSFGAPMATLEPVKPGSGSRIEVLTLSCTRDVLERTMRARVLEQYGGSGRLKYRTGVTVASLNVGADGKMSGVTCQKGADGERETIASDIVVDATGRAARGLRWLSALPNPVEPVVVESYDPLLLYAVAYVEDTADPRDRFMVSALNADAYTNPHRGAMIQRVEGGRAVVGAMVVGTNSIKAPTDEKGFMEHLRIASKGDDSLMRPFLEGKGAMVKDFKVVVKMPPSKRIRYDLVNNLPEGFFAVGDAACCVNPIYGQGLTMAAIGVSTLDRVLRTSRTMTGTTRTYFKLLHSRTHMPWVIPAGLDWLYKEVKPYDGAPVAEAANASWLVQHLTRACQSDGSLALFYWKMMAMMTFPSEMMSLKVWWAIFRSHFRMKAEERAAARAGK